LRSSSNPKEGICKACFNKTWYKNIHWFTSI
jgi:hypothetical protein